MIITRQLKLQFYVECPSNKIVKILLERAQVFLTIENCYSFCRYLIKIYIKAETSEANNQHIKNSKARTSKHQKSGYIN